MRCITNSLRETKRIAGEFGLHAIQRKRHKEQNALVIALSGDLGSGKTTFIQGFLQKLGIRRAVMSPTFVIARRYRIPKATKSGFLYIMHIDAYRIKKPAELASLGFREWARDPAALILVEWPRHIRSLLPRSTLRISLKHGRRENERILTFPRQLQITSH